MADVMMFPNSWGEFLEDYSFKDKEEVYTNGSMLVPTFRVEQMVEHYFNNAWIPVSERLPERGQEVIVASYRMIKPVVFTTTFWSKEHDNWYGITHWMPLPEPPKEENNNG